MARSVFLSVCPWWWRPQWLLWLWLRHLLQNEYIQPGWCQILAHILMEKAHSLCLNRSSWRHHDTRKRQQMGSTFQPLQVSVSSVWVCYGLLRFRRFARQTEGLNFDVAGLAQYLSVGLKCMVGGEMWRFESDSPDGEKLQHCRSVYPLLWPLQPLDFGYMATSVAWCS